ncbi:hypothetical protein ABMA75_03160 [Halobacteriovorax sp. ZH4_bin.1]|uniref:hypothetical protein n=1 Tax=unclassified Halobacteriovorax TaxID=2639665 RepID=UPI0037128102
MNGREVIRVFHEAQRYYYNVDYSLNELIRQVGPSWWPDAITTALELDDNITEKKASDAMTKLAYASRGKIPKDYNVFMMALANEVQTFSFDDFKNVFNETIEDTTTIVKTVAVGYGTWKILALVVPLLILLFKE